jgi:hypothetical protein
METSGTSLPPEMVVKPTSGATALTLATLCAGTVFLPHLHSREISRHCTNSETPFSGP